jgi:hypothetical protein
MWRNFDSRKNSVYTHVCFLIVPVPQIMKTPGILIAGALAVLVITVSSCANSGSHPASAAAPAASTANSAPRPAAVPAAPPVPVSLTQSFNDQGIYPDGAQFSGGIDRDGFGCSSNLLAVQTWNGVSFQPGGSNVITCQGQTIALTQPGHFSKLKVLALAVNGAQENQNFIVTRADGSNQAFTQSLSDWAQPDSYPGESTALTMEYRNQADGSKDENAFYIYTYSFDLDSTKTLQSLKLPDNNNVKVFAVALVP